VSSHWAIRDGATTVQLARQAGDKVNVQRFEAQLEQHRSGRPVHFGR